VCVRAEPYTEKNSFYNMCLCSYLRYGVCMGMSVDIRVTFDIALNAGKLVCVISSLTPLTRISLSSCNILVSGSNFNASVKCEKIISLCVTNVCICVRVHACMCLCVHVKERERERGECITKLHTQEMISESTNHIVRAMVCVCVNIHSGTFFSLSSLYSNTCERKIAHARSTGP